MPAANPQVPDELALALCFDVLSALEEMALSAISSLLHPWGWTRDALVSRLHELQNIGLLVLVDADTPAAREGRRYTDTIVRVTPAGRKVSGGHGLGSYRLEKRPGFKEPESGAVPTGGRPHSPKAGTEVR